MKRRPWNSVAQKRRACATCGCDFRPRSSVQKYCSRSCYVAARDARSVYRNCRVCGARFRVRFNKRQQAYCSRSCAAKDRRAEPRWHLSEKGEDACRNCGRSAAHLHHIVPRSLSPAGRYDVFHNGLPLCTDCHRGWHARSVTISGAKLHRHEYEFGVTQVGEGWMANNYPGEAAVGRRLEALA